MHSCFRFCWLCYLLNLLFCAKSAWICACSGRFPVSLRLSRSCENIHANGWLNGWMCAIAFGKNLLPIYGDNSCDKKQQRHGVAAVTAASATVAMVNTFGAVYFNYQQHIDVKHQKRVDVQSRQVKVHANQFPVFSFSFLVSVPINLPSACIASSKQM